MNKKAILVVSFGTSYLDSLKKCIESTEEYIKEAFKEYEVKRAFTSNIIRKKILNRDNVHINDTLEALVDLKNQGYKEVIVQPLHIMFGDEYDKIVKAVEKFKDEFEVIKLGRPLLYNNEDYKIAAKALKSQLPILKEKEAVVLMGHGTENISNASYFQYEFYVKECVNENIYLCNVEICPLIDTVIPKLKRKEIEKVYLMPFMLVAGDHATNDMAGDEEDSWKSILQKEGFKVECYLKGLGENKEFQKIYADHIKNCI